jgi:hypothetical protein
MRPWSVTGIGQESLTSTSNVAPVTANVPNNTSAIQVTVETTSCRMTVTSAGDPTSSTGLIIQKDQQPWFMPYAKGTVLKFASIAGTQSVIQIAYLS